MNKMISNALTAFRQLFDVKPGQTILIISDEATRDVADAWQKAASRLDCRVSGFVLPEARRPLQDIPPGLIDLMPGADVAITAFSGLVDEAPFRLSLLSELSRHVRRIGHSPGITRHMMTSGGMTADYGSLDATARDLIGRLEGAVSLRITAPGGTEITLDVTGRPFASDTAIPDGSACNLPCGEVWCAPIEPNANGVIVCDGSVGDLGRVPSPVTLVVNNGKVTSVMCQDPDFKAEIETMLEYDAGAGIIGEFGIGINPAASVIGNLLEDEKAAGTSHIAFGNNIGMAGGRNASGTHQDFLFNDPTVTATFADGREATILISGRITRATRHHDANQAFPWSDVMVIVDFSPASERAVAMADMIARQHGARLTACHVINTPIPVNMLFPQYSAINAGMTHLKAEHADCTRHLNAMINDLTGRKPDEYEIAVFIGDPVRSVLEYAGRHGIDLLVVPEGPERQARRFATAGLKSVADNAGCDVLVVRG